MYAAVDVSGTRSGRYILLVCLCVSGLLVFLARPGLTQTTPPGEVLTLKKAIETALRNQPTIEAQTGQVLAGEAKTGEARGSYYPHLSIGSAYTRIWPVGVQTSASTSLAGVPPGSYIPSATSAQGGSYEQYAGTANLSQLLFDFGKTRAQVGVQRANTQAARHELQNVREQVIFNVKQSYYGVLSAEQSRDVAGQAVEQFRKHLEYARALFEVGSKPRFDVTKAEVDLSNAEVALIKAENNVRLTRVTLNNAMGLPDVPPYSVEEDLSPPEMKVPFETALQKAFDRRPDLLALKKQQESAREAIKVAQRGHLPSFNGSASLIYVGTAFPLDHGWTAGMNMVLPLFTGFVTSYQVAEAQASLITVSANIRNIKQTIRLELEQAFLALREASERMNSTVVAARQGKENLDLATERYGAGLAIGVEVTDAVVSYANAQMSNIAAHYDYKVAEARIEKAMGGQL